MPEWYKPSRGMSNTVAKGETRLDGNVEFSAGAVDFMLSPEGQKIVEDSGYIPVVKPD